jgi:hypothetical protein
VGIPFTVNAGYLSAPKNLYISVVDYQRIFFLRNSTNGSAANDCHSFYERAGNQPFLYDDTLLSVLGPATPGAAQTVQNWQCILTVNLGLTLKTPFADTSRNIYILSQDMLDINLGWVQT